MGAQINISRKKAFCGCATICKIEIDGALLGEVRNGESIVIETSEGMHRFRFLDSSDKLLRTGTLTIDGEKDVLLEIQFNGATGKLEVFSPVAICNTETPKGNAGGKLTAVFILIIVSSFFIYFGANKLFSKPDMSPSSNTQGAIQYEAVNLQDMLNELKTNALRAEATYQDKHIEITGVIRVFDSDGKYIAIVPCGASDWSLETVQCYLTDPSHKAFLLEKSVGDVVTIRGKVFSIGEVLGYSVRISEISD